MHVCLRLCVRVCVCTLYTGLVIYVLQIKQICQKVVNLSKVHSCLVYKQEEEPGRSKPRRSLSLSLSLSRSRSRSLSLSLALSYTHKHTDTYRKCVCQVAILSSMQSAAVPLQFQSYYLTLFTIKNNVTLDVVLFSQCF